MQTYGAGPRSAGQAALGRIWPWALGRSPRAARRKRGCGNHGRQKERVPTCRVRCSSCASSLLLSSSRRLRSPSSSSIFNLQGSETVSGPLQPRGRVLASGRRKGKGHETRS